MKYKVGDYAYWLDDTGKPIAHKILRITFQNATSRPQYWDENGFLWEHHAIKSCPLEYVLLGFKKD